MRALRQDLGDEPAAARHDTLVVPLPVPAAGPPPPPDGPQAEQAAAAAAPRRLRGLSLALVVLLLGLLAGGGGWYLGAGRFTRAPSVLAMTLADAEQRLGAAGLKVRLEPERFDEAVPAGQVLDQDPDPNGRVRKDGAVGLVLSKGPDRRAVPAEVVGATVPQATRSLEAVGLRAGDVSTAFSASPEGTVVRTRPGARRGAAPRQRRRAGRQQGRRAAAGPGRHRQAARRGARRP